MNAIPITLLATALSGVLSAAEGIQTISLEVQSDNAAARVVQIVVRDQSGHPVATDESLVVDVVAPDQSALVTITVPAGATSAAVPLATAMPLSQIRGLIRVGDTGAHAGELLAVPALPLVTN